VRRLIAAGLLLMTLASGCGARPQTGTGIEKQGANPGVSSGTIANPATANPATTDSQPKATRCTVPTPAAKVGYITVTVYYTCEDDPDHALPVARQVPATDAVLNAALTELLKGPTDAEKAAGLRSWFSGATAGMLREVRIQDGTAHVDFKNFQTIIPNASTSAGSAQLLTEVGRTIFQFKAVMQADVRFDGSCQAFWGWLQRDCQTMQADRYRQ
jgi:spore germination protein GerM